MTKKLMLFILSMASVAAGLKCYVCNNCIKYEMSQSRPCGPLDNTCMKIDMITGQVQRRCGSTRICLDPIKHLRTQYKKVNCCEEENCNSSTKLTNQCQIPVIALFYIFYHYA